MRELAAQMAQIQEPNKEKVEAFFSGAASALKLRLQELQKAQQEEKAQQEKEKLAQAGPSKPQEKTEKEPEWSPEEIALLSKVADRLSILLFSQAYF